MSIIISASIIGKSIPISKVHSVSANFGYVVPSLHVGAIKTAFLSPKPRRTKGETNDFWV